MKKFHPIAIVGQGCALPQAFSPKTFWDCIVQEKSLITEKVDDGSWGENPKNFLSENGKL